MHKNGKLYYDLGGDEIQPNDTFTIVPQHDDEECVVCKYIIVEQQMIVNGVEQRIPTPIIIARGQPYSPVQFEGLVLYPVIDAEWHEKEQTI